MSLDPRDRWRLILGRQQRELGPEASRLATALDELYGSGRGEGSRVDLGGGAGRERSFPSARAWKNELEALFGEEVREEVVGRAVEGGKSGLLLDGELENISPSIELLEQVLSLKGALAEGHLARLRPLVARIVDALVEELAVRVQPAMVGLTTPRTTRRPGGPLDLRRTVMANLGRSRMVEGRPQLVPEELFYRQRGRRSMDHRVILVVDVSGSMEASVIYSAMMAAILSGVPWIDVRFIVFSTEVIDLSERAPDPLGLLLEISVGGGTHIARGLRYARELMKVPKRTLVICVSDFDEGFPVGGLLGEVRALVESGARPLGVAALNDSGQPRYNKAIAEQIAHAGMPVAALTPLELARWIGDQVRG